MTSARTLRRPPAVPRRPRAALARGAAAAATAVASVAALAPAGCAPERDVARRCEALRAELDACFGTRLNGVDCAATAEADVARLEALTRGLSCATLAGAAPIDGDPASASCRLLGVGCAAPAGEAPARRPARYPVVLVNGIDSSPLFRYSERVVRALVDGGGHQVFLASLPPYRPPTARTPALWARVQDVLARAGAEKVNLVCHSLGGLDCRYLVSPGGFGPEAGVDPDAVAARVASVTTVGTAHRGTRVADLALGLVPDGDRAETLDDLVTLVADAFGERKLRDETELADALSALTTDRALVFNRDVPDAAGVYYQSWAGFSRPFGRATGELAALADELCRPDEGGPAPAAAIDYLALPLVPFADRLDEPGAPPSPNDGFVAVASAKWGNFRGCVPADHMEQLGQRNLPDVNVRNGFDVARFYAAVAADLAARGF